MLRQYKQKILEEYVKQLNDGPKQGTEEWLSRRKKTIGGSEISTIIGVNRYSSIYVLLLNKTGLGQGHVGDIKTRWGNLFEDILCKYVEHDLHTEIIGDELFIPGLIPEQSYSPDGLGVVEFDEEVEICGAKYKYRVAAAALFEFKCPFNRIPNGSIREYYVPQVKAGLDTIPVVDIGIFAEAVIRRCTIDSLGYNPVYDSTLNGKTGRPVNTLPLAYGFVAFYDKESKPAVDPPIDYGQISVAEVELLFEQAITKKIYNIWYSRPVYGDAQDTTKEDLLAVKDKRAVGILPWKMFRVDYHKVSRPEGYIDKYADKMKEIIAVVDKCMKIDKDNRLEIIDEYIEQSG